VFQPEGFGYAGAVRRIGAGAIGDMALLDLQPGDCCITASDVTGRLCCKSRFALMIKNSAGYRRGFRVKM
jgi:hypothetical protein